MSTTRNPTMLQRLPAILAVTAHSFGLGAGDDQGRHGAAHERRPAHAGGHPSKERHPTRTQKAR